MIQSISGNNDQTQTLELALLPDITCTLPVFSFLCISFILISLRHLSAVLILFSSLSCTECLLHCDFYPKWKSTVVDCIHQYNAIFPIPSGSVLKCYQLPKCYERFIIWNVFYLFILLYKNILYPNKSNKLFSFIYQ